MDDIELKGNITRIDIEEVNSFQQISFSNREDNLTAYIEVPLKFVDLRNEKELTVIITSNDKKEADEDYKDSKIVFNSTLYNLDVHEDTFSYYFSAGGFVLRFTTPEEYKFDDLSLFRVIVK